MNRANIQVGGEVTEITVSLVEGWINLFQGDSAQESLIYLKPEHVPDLIDALRRIQTARQCANENCRRQFIPTHRDKRYCKVSCSTARRQREARARARDADAGSEG